MKPTITATLTRTIDDKPVPVPGAPVLTLTLPIDSPARAHALLTLSSAIVRGDLQPDDVRAALSGDGGLTLDDVEAAYARLHASHGFLIGGTLTHIDGKPAALDAVARGKIPPPACPACGSVESMVVAAVVAEGHGLSNYRRRCVGCRNEWADPDDARRYVGPDWRHAFGLAVVEELRALGLSMGFIGKVGAAAQGALTEIAGAGDKTGADVSFS